MLEGHRPSGKLWETREGNSLHYWTIDDRGLTHGSVVEGRMHTDNVVHFSIAQILRRKSLDDVLEHLPEGVNMGDALDIWIRLVEQHPRRTKTAVKLRALRESFVWRARPVRP